MAIFIAILLALGGGVSVVAQNSLPGDALYPVKVNVNEEVRSWLTLDSESKANWDVVLASRRLEEAEELAVQGDLDAAVRAQIEENFRAHSDRVQSRIEAFEDKEAGTAAEVASNLLTSLKAHERILLNIGTAKDGQVETEVNLLNNSVKSESRETMAAQARAEAEFSATADVQAAAEGRMTAAENKIKEVEKFIEDKQDSFDSTTVVQANARLDLADSLMVQGKAKLESEDYSEAFVLFGKAHATAQEAKLLLIAQIRFENGNEEDGTSSPAATTSSGASVQGSTSAGANMNNNGSVNSSGGVRIDLGL